jgi:glycyl-tRNA synthetase
MIYAVLEQAYHEEMVEGEVRTVLRLPPLIAPVQVAVFPLMNRDGLDTLAREIAGNIQQLGILAEYDDSGAIGRRYRRQDEIGTPFAITIDYDSLDDRTVTLRDRDSMKQVRLPINRVPELVRDLIAGRTDFSRLNS